MSILRHANVGEQQHAIDAEFSVRYRRHLGELEGAKLG